MKKPYRLLKKRLFKIFYKVRFSHATNMPLKHLFNTTHYNVLFINYLILEGNFNINLNIVNTVRVIFNLEEWKMLSC